MLASFLKRDPKNLIQRDASSNFQAQNGLLSLRSWWRSVRSLRKLLEFVERRKQALPDLHAMDELEKRIRESIADMFNRLLPRRDLYEPEAWDGVELGDEASMLLDRGIGGLGQSDVARLNRLLIEAAFPFPE